MRKIDPDVEGSVILMLVQDANKLAVGPTNVAGTAEYGKNRAPDLRRGHTFEEAGAVGHYLEGATWFGVESQH